MNLNQAVARLNATGQHSGDLAAYAAESAEVIVNPPADFAVFVKSEIQQWSEVGRAAKIPLVDR